MNNLRLYIKSEQHTDDLHTEMKLKVKQVQKHVWVLKTQSPFSNFTHVIKPLMQANTLYAFNKTFNREAVPFFIFPTSLYLMWPILLHCFVFIICRYDNTLFFLAVLSETNMMISIKFLKRQLCFLTNCIECFTIQHSCFKRFSNYCTN